MVIDKNPNWPLLIGIFYTTKFGLLRFRESGIPNTIQLSL
ncbi:hypothetical protein JCM19298_548 [Nonlabens ulvanivorans]|nr:hypothetical protein JCM19297_1903 [Nonlabens ulvanivorans]GAK94073.1 hypothetical protein JCM19298_548 [Nonlabens ulvanivorans]